MLAGVHLQAPRLPQELCIRRDGCGDPEFRAESDLQIGVLLLRFSISQMDVPTRQSYTMAVVRPEERSAAAGITGVARTIGASIPPLFVGLMFATPSLINAPFFIAGTLKIAYDLLLYWQFVAIQPPEGKSR